MNSINQQTQGPLVCTRFTDNDKDRSRIDSPNGRVIASTACQMWDGKLDQGNTDARLLAASYNAFDSAGRALGIDASLLAESIDLAALIAAAQAVIDDLPFDELTEGQSVRAHRLIAILSNLPKPQSVTSS